MQIAKLLLSATAILCISPALGFSDDVIDGTWKWSKEMGGNTINSVLRLNSDGNKVSGKYSDQNIEVPVKGEVKDGNVWLNFDAKVGDTAIEVSLDGEFTDAEIEGAIEVTTDTGEELEVDWLAKRSTEIADVVGKWEFEYTIPTGEVMRPVLELKKEGGKLQGVLEGANGRVDLDKVELKNHNVTFAFTTQYNGSDLDLRYICKPRGDKLTGRLEYSVDGNEGDFEIKAKRSRLSKKAQALVGAWKCNTVDPTGVSHDSILVIKDAGGKLGVELSSETADLTVHDIKLDDDEAVISAQVNHDGTTVDLTWRVAAKGDALTGVIEFSADGESGQIDVSGKRQDD